MLDLDLDTIDPNADPKTLRKNMENGGLVPAGKYHAAIVDASTKTAGETSINELDFRILHGPHAGNIVKAKLWNTDKPANRNRHILFMLALCMIEKKDGKYVRHCEHYEDVAAHQVSCVIDVEHVEYKKKDSDKKGVSAEVKFNGIFGETDPEAAHVPRNKSAIRVFKPTASGAAPTPRQSTLDL
jgi:hypothetical protein